MDGQLVEFSHGPGEAFRWSGQIPCRDSVESRITSVPVKVNRSPRSLSGSRALGAVPFAGQGHHYRGQQYRSGCEIYADDGEMRYRLHAASNTNPVHTTAAGRVPPAPQLVLNYRSPAQAGTCAPTFKLRPGWRDPEFELSSGTEDMPQASGLQFTARVGDFPRITSLWSALR